MMGYDGTVPIVVTRCDIEGCELEDVSSNGGVVLQVCTRCGGMTIRAER